MPSHSRSSGVQVSGYRQQNHKFTPDQRASIMMAIHRGESYRLIVACGASYHDTLKSLTISDIKKRWNGIRTLISALEQDNLFTKLLVRRESWRCRHVFAPVP